MRKATINFTISLDENNLPETIEWNASDSKDGGKCKAIFLSMWDENEKNTMRIDLWTKDMPVEDMKRFFHQNLVTMSDTLQRATNEEKMSMDMRDFSSYFAEKMGLVDPA